MNAEQWSHRTELPLALSSAELARRFVAEHLAAHRLDHLTDDVQLVVSELSTNAIEHARTPFTVLLEHGTDGLRLAVTDRSSSPLVPRAPDETTLRGRGLAIVDALAGSWGVIDTAEGEKSVWVAFVLPPA
jgi:anti-sigma regulatory factor (Ser/Thr protein kinase)